MIYFIGVVFFFFAVSGEKQPWADGTEAVHKEDVPYSKTGKTNNRPEEEKKPLLQQDDDAGGSDQGGRNQQPGSQQ